MTSFYDTLHKDVLLRLAQKTVQILPTKGDLIKAIKWTDGESNTDTGFSQLACICCQEAWLSIKDSYPDYADLTLTCHIPDINLTFSKDGVVVEKSKIELKSSKGLTLPGSTIGKLDINQPMIYCYRKELDGTCEFRYSQYYNCMGETKRDLFQDRTPRPGVNFQKMADAGTELTYVEKEKGHWVQHYAECALTRIQSNCRSWQDGLVKAILDSFVRNTSVEAFAEMKAKLG
jgi:hypothetical protein